MRVGVGGGDTVDHAFRPVRRTQTQLPTLLLSSYAETLNHGGLQAHQYRTDQSHVDELANLTWLTVPHEGLSAHAYTASEWVPLSKCSTYGGSPCMVYTSHECICTH